MADNEDCIYEHIPGTYCPCHGSVAEFSTREYIANIVADDE